MLPPLASTSELETRLGVTLSGADLSRASAALADASALIRQEADEDWVDDEGDLEDVPDIVSSVCLAVAYRAYRNPEGTVQASVGDVSVTYGRQGGGGAIYLTQAELRAVRKAAGKAAVTTLRYTTPYIPSRVPAEGDEWWEVYD